uniref:ribosomal protein L23 n=1 Tax=Madagascaria erythrocladioides TaxID=753684 RepID=UPI001FCD2280|nr:ribosomal protein L23 [Madagascaria erythrocladioides]UNJ16572.1 ribosomal protein L23 [Madagascaria erythrocladioides]
MYCYYRKIDSYTIYSEYPIITDKTTQLIEENQYSFSVDYQLSKDLIKKEIEDLFNVKVIAVNTCKLPKKKKRMGKFAGYRSNYKKAIVTLAEGDSINLFLNN